MPTTPTNNTTKHPTTPEIDHPNQAPPPERGTPRKFHPSHSIWWQKHHHAGGPWKRFTDWIHQHLNAPNAPTALIEDIDNAWEHHPDKLHTPWVGVWHTPILHNRPKGIHARITHPDWPQVQQHCQGIITLCAHTADYIHRQTKLPTTVVLHPALHPSPQDYPGRPLHWHPTRTTLSQPQPQPQPQPPSSQPTLTLIGAHQRRIDTFYALRTPGIHKQWLRSVPDTEYAVPLPDPESAPEITTLPRLSDNAYHDLLTRTIVYFDPYDLAAANTLLECLVRYTPILLRHHPAAHEYLPPEYPLYFDTLEQAEDHLQNPRRILNAHYYLATNPILPQLSLAHATRTLTNSYLYQSLPTVPEG
jgi:hypothetical protein